jgi:uncharacterized protein with HEPN domain
LDNLKDNRYYAEKILHYVTVAIDCAKRVDFSDPEANEESIFAINFCLIEIREFAQKLSPDFREKNFPVSIEDLALFRNTLTHDYGNVDFSLYRSLVKKDLPKIRKALKEYLR